MLWLRIPKFQYHAMNISCMIFDFLTTVRLAKTFIETVGR